MYPLHNHIYLIMIHLQNNVTEEECKKAEKRIKRYAEITAALSDHQDKKIKESSTQKSDYIHVRARRGQATDSHSLAERVLSVF